MTTARELLQNIVDFYDARSELVTNDADLAGTMYDKAKAFLAQPEPEPTNRDRELAKDAIAFLRLNDMHLAAGVVSKYVLGSTE